MKRRAPALVALLFASAATPAAAELYRWVAPDGTIHYTAELSSVPPAARPGVRVIDAPLPRPVTTAPAPLTPPAAAAPLVVDAHVNGVALKLLVDTGADRTVIAPAVLVRAGVAVAGPPVRVMGVTGTADATLVTVPDLEVAGTRLGPLPVVAHTVPVDDVDGLLGRDVLHAFAVTTDPVTQRPTLSPR